MNRRVFALLAAGVSALVATPVGLAQSDVEQSVGVERAKVDEGELLMRMGFTFARSDIPESVRYRLDAVALVIANERVKAEIEVTGHTDSVGSEEYNQVLSEKRAEAVKAYLVEHGVPANRVSVVGYGESQPRDTNDTIEGRRLNRRVEIRAFGG